MEPSHVKIVDIKYRRPGLSKVYYSAEYDSRKEEGVIVYDTVNRKFLNHTKDIALLAAVCSALQHHKRVG